MPRSLKFGPTSENSSFPRYPKLVTGLRVSAIKKILFNCRYITTFVLFHASVFFVIAMYALTERLADC